MFDSTDSFMFVVFPHTDIELLLFFKPKPILFDISIVEW